MKLYADGSVLDGIAGTGMILWDHEGSIIFNSCRHLHTCNDILEVEILAIMEGLSLALQWSNLPVEVESESLEAVSMIKSMESNKSGFEYSFSGL